MQENKLYLLIGVVIVIGAAVFYFSSNGPTPKDSAEISMPVQTPTLEAKTPESSNSATKNNMYSKAPEMKLDSKKDYSAVIKTSKGDITVDLFEGKVPATVNNFVFFESGRFLQQHFFSQNNFWVYDTGWRSHRDWTWRSRI
jgi:hypothetical protein